MSKVVTVKFRGNGSSVYNSKDYYYKTFFDVCAGDLVIVNTSTRGCEVAMVSCEDIQDPHLVSKATKYLVQRVDMEQYQTAVQREKELHQLKRDMDTRVKALQETALYEMLSKEDTELRDLLYRYKELKELPI